MTIKHSHNYETPDGTIRIVLLKDKDGDLCVKVGIGSIEHVAEHGAMIQYHEALGFYPGIRALEYLGRYPRNKQNPL